MMDTNRFRFTVICALSVVLLACGQGFCQSLEEIIQNHPQADQPVVQPPAGQTPAAPDAPAPAIAQNPADDVDAIRRRIIEIAESMVGTVVDRPGDDGNKIGWQNLKKFYEVAYKLDDLEKERPQWMSGIKGVGKKVNEWCGIFGTWAWRTAGVPVHWNTKIIGCKYHGKKDRLAPGDIVVMQDKPAPPPKPGEKPKQPLYHHCIIKSINGNTMMTINGNAGVDSVNLAERKISDISIIYSVSDALGVKPATPAPQGQAAKPAPTAGQATKPAPATGQGTTAPSKPTNPETGTKPGQEPLSQQETDNLVSMVMMLIRITLGQWF